MMFGEEVILVTKKVLYEKNFYNRATSFLVQDFIRSMKKDETKQRKVAVEYVNLCGLNHVNNQFRTFDNRNFLTQEELAGQLGVSVTTLNEMLAIEPKLTPEMKALLIVV